MKNNFLKKYSLIFIIFIYSILIISCGKDFASSDIVEGTVVLSDTDIDLSENAMPVQMWHQTNKTLCVLIGYGYNTPELSEEIINLLAANFGLKEDNGLILPLVYPNDFKRGNKYYISELKNILKDKDLCGIILLGAPEGTNNAILRIEDLYGGIKAFPVFSFFSQDELLGMEFASDFVLDKAMKANITGVVEEEVSHEPVENISNILIRSVECMTMLEQPLTKDKNLLDIVKYIVQEDKIHRYSDLDTGLYSINHFVLE